MQKFWKYLLVCALVFGLFTEGWTKPAGEEEDNNDYLHDDGEDYNDHYEDEESSSQNKNDQDNNINSSLGKPILEKSFATYEAKEGESVRMECGIKNKGNDILLWKAEQGLTQERNVYNPRFKLNEDWSLTIISVQQSDAKEYKCQAVPSNIISYAKLVVKTPASIKILVNNQESTSRALTYREGEKIRLDCEAHGTPKPKIVWSSEGKRLDKQSGVIVENETVIIESAEPHHGSVYQCFAENHIGNPAHEGVTINIEYSPKVSAHRTDVNTGEGETAELHCTYKSVPEGRVQWIREKSVLVNDEKYQIRTHPHHKHHHNQSTLIIKNVGKGDLGRYECEVTNRLDKGATNITLIYEPEQGVLEGYELERENDHVFMNWTVRSAQAISEVTIFYKKQGSQAWNQAKPLEINKLQAGIWQIQHRLHMEPGLWDTRIKTRNTQGWSKFSQEHKIQIPTIHTNEDEYGSDMVALDSTEKVNSAWTRSPVNCFLLTTFTALTGRLLL